jgi:predicted transposase YdaD
LEALMMTESEFYSDTFRNAEAKGRAEGRVEGSAAAKVEAVLTILQARGIALTEEQKERINGYQDQAQLETWIARAATAESVGELFD